MIVAFLSTNLEHHVDVWHYFKLYNLEIYFKDKFWLRHHIFNTGGEKLVFVTDRESFPEKSGKI